MILREMIGACSLTSIVGDIDNGNTSLSAT
jgi:hypothetical protein